MTFTSPDRLMPAVNQRRRRRTPKGGHVIENEGETGRKSVNQGWRADALAREHVRKATLEGHVVRDLEEAFRTAQPRLEHQVMTHTAITGMRSCGEFEQPLVMTHKGHVAVRPVSSRS